MDAAVTNDAATEALIARLIAEDLDGRIPYTFSSNDAPSEEPSTATVWGDDNENLKRNRKEPEFQSRYDVGIDYVEVDNGVGTKRWDHDETSLTHDVAEWGISSSSRQWGTTTTSLPIHNSNSNRMHGDEEAESEVPDTAVLHPSNDCETAIRLDINDTVSATIRREGKGKGREIVHEDGADAGSEGSDGEDEVERDAEDHDWFDDDDGHVDLTLIIGRKHVHTLPLFPSIVHTPLCHQSKLTSPPTNSTSPNIPYPLPTAIDSLSSRP